MNHVVRPRAIPTVMNGPALDPVLLADGRAPNPHAQARGAIADHAQSTQVSAQELDALVAYERTLFNDERLRSFARGGPPPQLPLGNTVPQIRGRLAFEAFCAGCHGGLLLNTSGPLHAVINPQTPAGSRFETVGVSEQNPLGLPRFELELTRPDGTTVRVVTPDAGRALVTGRVEDVNRFKIPTLWGINKTGPYFHDHSAKTLEEVMRHYDRFFRTVRPFLGLSPEQQADLVEFCRFL